MRELGADDYEQLMRSPPIRDGLAGIEARRKAAARRFWTVLPIGGLVLAGIFYLFYQWGEIPIGAVIVVIGAIGIWFGASWGLMRTNDDLKAGIFREAGRMLGLRYTQRTGDHLLMSEAHPFLFHSDGSWSVDDLFEGEPDAGRQLAFFETCITRKTGDDDNEKTVTDFRGQVFTFTRAQPGEGVVAVRPRQGGLLSFAVSVDVPGFTATTSPVEIGDDPPFDSAFSVLASDAAVARTVLVPEVRGLLRELRARERVWFYCGPKHMLIALWGDDRFEGGNLLTGGPTEKRIRRMIDDLNDSVRTAQQLSAVVDQANDRAG